MVYELKSDITRETPASFEPSIDYVVTKSPRFAFEKFPQVESQRDSNHSAQGWRSEPDGRGTPTLGKHFHKSIHPERVESNLTAPIQLLQSCSYFLTATQRSRSCVTATPG